jgi:hypothetical protein
LTEFPIAEGKRQQIYIIVHYKRFRSCVRTAGFNIEPSLPVLITRTGLM